MQCDENLYVEVNMYVTHACYTVQKKVIGSHHSQSTVPLADILMEKRLSNVALS